MRVALVVPMKSFNIAKGRLSDVLDANERQQLARDCAQVVLGAAGGWPKYVVCDADDVANWAKEIGAHIVSCPTPGLDVAVAAGITAAIADGAQHIVVAHADLPLAHTYQHLVLDAQVALVPDRHMDGTNVLSFPADMRFATAYGPQSFIRHQEILTTLGHRYVVVNDEELALDLDTADDLTELRKRT